MSRFDYGWGSFNQSLRPIQKMPLTLYEATFPHIRLHKLTKDDSLQFFMSMMASIPATLGVVLINFDNSYQLSEKFLSNGESPIVPVILVTNETGSELLHFLHENPRDTEVTVHSEDYQPPEPSPLPCKFPIGEYLCYRQLVPGYMVHTRQSNTTQQKDKATQHNLPKAVFFKEKSCLGWDSNPRPSAF